jgi:hypothetical protein
MSQPELLASVIRVPQAAGVDYMVTGSVASSLQGEPRSTHDIDLVVNIRTAAVRQIVQAFQMPDYYLDEASVHEAIRQSSMFNLIDVNNGDKVDFWLLTNDPFDRSRFARRYGEEFMGITFQVSSPEDTILAKLPGPKCRGAAKSSSPMRCGFTKFSTNSLTCPTSKIGPNGWKSRHFGSDCNKRQARFRLDQRLRDLKYRAFQLSQIDRRDRKPKVSGSTVPALYRMDSRQTTPDPPRGNPIKI